MSAGKTSVPVVLATLLLVSCVALATTFEVPLTGLIGQYGVEPTIGTSSYDFGTSFSQIDSALLRIEGSFHPGLFYYENLNDPFDRGTVSCFGHWIKRRPNSAVSYSRDYVSGGNPFGVVSHYYPSEYQYDSFTQGTAEVSFEFECPYFLAIYFVQVLEAPYATVTEATLTIEGTAVGEPIPGDLNLSGCVDDDDLSLLLASWNIEQWPPYTDPTGDGIIDDDDLSLLLLNWGEGCSDGDAQVPPGEAPVIVEETWIIDPDPVPDINGDGCVDDDDLSLLLANWDVGTTWGEGGPHITDLNHDGLVGDDDLSILLASWGCGDGAAPVPEPTALVLLCAAALAIPRRRRA